MKRAEVANWRTAPGIFTATTVIYRFVAPTATRQDWFVIIRFFGLPNSSGDLSNAPRWSKGQTVFLAECEYLVLILPPNEERRKVAYRIKCWQKLPPASLRSDVPASL